jgi:hypothetical protein
MFNVCWSFLPVEGRSQTTNQPLMQHLPNREEMAETSQITLHLPCCRALLLQGLCASDAGKLDHGSVIV